VNVSEAEYDCIFPCLENGSGASLRDELRTVRYGSMTQYVCMPACVCVCFYGSKHWIEAGRSFQYCFTTNHRTLWCSPQIWHGYVLHIVRAKLRYWPSFTVLRETASIRIKLKDRKEIQTD